MTSSGTPFLVRVSGLLIQVDAPLDGLPSLDASETPDVRVRMRGSLGMPSASQAGSDWYVSPYRDERDVPLLTIRRVETGYLLCFAEGARFLVSAAGSDVDAWWDRALDEIDAADYLFGGVLAFIVRLRGLVPLHASAVVIEERALVIAGAAGAGKSSLAAAFASLGYPLVSDDIVVVDHSGAGAMAFPGRPRLKLWMDSARSLFPLMTLPAYSAAYDKRRLDLLEHGYRFRDRPVPIGTIAILADRRSSTDQLTLRPLRPQDAMMRLVGCTYGNYLLDASMRAREFDLLGRLAGAIGVSELSVGSGLDGLVSDCHMLAERLALQSAT